LRKTTSTPTSTPRSPEPIQPDDPLALTDDDIRARSIRRTTRESAERGAVAQVAGTVGSVAVGALEGTITRLLKVLRIPIAILIGLWFVLNIEGMTGIIVAIVVSFVASLVLGALVNWLELRAYRRRVK